MHAVKVWLGLFFYTLYPFASARKIGPFSKPYIGIADGLRARTNDPGNLQGWFTTLPDAGTSGAGNGGGHGFGAAAWAILGVNFYWRLIYLGVFSNKANRYRHFLPYSILIRGVLCAIVGEHMAG